MNDSDIIDNLGGTGVVAGMFDIRPSSVSEWRKNGIPKARRQYLKLLRPDLCGPAPSNSQQPEQEAA